MAKEKFFSEQAEQSQVKTAIVTKYFWAWANVMLGHLSKSKHQPRIAYIDLFSGPGRYEDGKKSTPLLILEQAIAEEKCRKSLVTIFNDGEDENTSSLKKAIAEIEGIDTLTHSPQVNCSEVGEEIVKIFEKMKLIPTLFFVDPFGYKGLSLRLINSVLKDWGCECIFFFNYNRINAGITNQSVKTHMDALFGEERGENLRRRLNGLDPSEREIAVIEEICEALIEMGGEYTLPFRFRNAAGSRTSHHLIFVSKHHLGYNIMKEVMAKESSTHEQGVPSFEYNPASKKYRLLFDLLRPLDDLEEMLLEKYAGQRMKMENIFLDHNYGLPYIKKNYKDVLLKMEIDGKIKTDRPYTTRPIRNGDYTFADKVVVQFPE